MLNKKDDTIFFILPAVIILFAVIVYPIIDTTILSFYKVNRSGIKDSFVGIKNYISLFQDHIFWQVLLQTLKWTISLVLIVTIIGFIVALLLNREFRFRNLARLAIILPWGISQAILALIWRNIYSYDFGLLNHTLRSLGLIQNNIPWLAFPNSAFIACIWVGVVNSIPFTSLGFLGGLQSIPKEIIEAAEIDGINTWKKVFYIIIPMMKHVFTIITLVNIILIFRSFPIVWVLTRGGPINFTDIFSTYLYKTTFSSLDFGSASAMVVTGFVIMIGFVIFYNKLVFKKEQI